MLCNLFILLVVNSVLPCASVSCSVSRKRSSGVVETPVTPGPARGNAVETQGESEEKDCHSQGQAKRPA